MIETAKTTKALLFLYLTIFSSWMVYATCQEDFILPFIGLFVITISILQTIFNPKIDKKELKKTFSWATALSLSLLLGWVWITIQPRQYPSDFIQSYAIFILQSGSIFLTLFLWFKPSYLYRVFFIRLLSWLTVSVSVNVAFTPSSFLAFGVFCILNIGIIIFSRYKLSYLRKNKFLLSQFVKRIFIISLYITITIGFFLLFVAAFKISDAVYMRFIKDYSLIYKRHPFFNFNPTLDIQGPGYSGTDVRPVMEVERNDASSVYLLTQIFETYENGQWKVSENEDRFYISDKIDPDKTSTHINMLVQLKDIVPTLKGTDAIFGYNGPYEKDFNGIVYSLQKNIHQITTTTSSQLLQFPIPENSQFTKLNPEFKNQLKPHLISITENNKDPWVIAQYLEYYFRSQYGYSLNVPFKADDRGMLHLIKNKPEAYCSFFASTMTVLLRSADIPSRLVVGFLGTETTGREKDKFLIRVRDAHAWVEAYLPSKDHPGTSEWVRFDPTPPDARWNLLNDGRPINRIADYIWLSIVRFRSDFKNLESEKLLFRLVIVLFFLVFIRNYSTIVRIIQWIRHPKEKRKQLKDQDMLRLKLATYQKFENVLKKTFKTKQGLTETHYELLLRLKKDHPAKEKSILEVHQFLKEYQRIRFGEKPHQSLDKHLNNIKATVK